MSDIMNALSGILSDEESMRQLSELAQMLQAGEETEAPPPAEEKTSGGGMPDIDMMMKFAQIAGSLNGSDKNTELLLALRPHLGEEKQLKLDRAVRLLRLLTVYETAKESGMLGGLI